MVPIILKFLVITGLLATGAFFLAKGLGVNLAVVKYNGLEAYNLPVGVTLLVTAVAIAKFWKIQKKVFKQETTTTTYDDGTKQTTTTTTSEITTTAAAPFQPPSDSDRL